MSRLTAALLALMLAACTLVVIRGSENEVTDPSTSMHGGSLSIQRPATPASGPHPVENLLHKNDTHH